MKMTMNAKPETIFVNIASYRDPELLPTLRDMISRAMAPHLLHIAVCWQYADENASLFTQAGMNRVNTRASKEELTWHFRWQEAKITVIPVHYFRSQGACWARFIAEQYYAEETFSLQIDSHCRFIDHWDKHMVEMLDELRTQSPKPVLSTYPPAYDPNIADEKKEQFLSRLIFREFSKEGLPMLSSTPLNAPSPVRGSYIAGGFIFGDGSFVRDVANDPNIFFAGEEIAMAARAFTHGYDVYTPHRILLWHYYGRQKANKVWADHTHEAKSSGDIEMAWWERDAVSKKRIRTLFELEEQPVDLGPYGAGSIRSIYEFERLIGVDFKRRAVLPDVIGKESRSVFFPNECPNDEEWLQRLIFPFAKKVMLNKTDVEEAITSAKWWHFGLYSETNRLISQKKISQKEMESAFNATESTQFNVPLNFNTQLQEKPVTLRICPFDEQSGWGNVMEQVW